MQPLPRHRPGRHPAPALQISARRARIGRLDRPPSPLCMTYALSASRDLHDDLVGSQSPRLQMVFLVAKEQADPGGAAAAGQIFMRALATKLNRRSFKACLEIAIRA